MLTSDTPEPSRDGKLWFKCQSGNGEGHGLIPMEHTTVLDDQDMVGLAFMPNVLRLAREPAPAPAPAPVAAPAAAGQVTEHQRREFLTWAQTRGGLERDEAMSVLDRQIRLIGEGRSATGDAIHDAEAQVRQLRSEREEQEAAGAGSCEVRGWGRQLRSERLRSERLGQAPARAMASGGLNLLMFGGPTSKYASKQMVNLPPPPPPRALQNLGSLGV
eukprot:COSAG04_NODE_1876_length_5329_cov_70.433078_2_plen_217_part_00